MAYIDAYLLATPKDKVETYKEISRRSAAIWAEVGAVGYCEALGDDVPYGELTSFPRAVMAKDDESVVLSWISYPSRQARDEGSKKAMSDPRMAEMMQTMPVDGNRMIFGGFTPIVEGGSLSAPFGYVDGFVLAVPPGKLDAYKEMARVGQTVWSEHGAIGYLEAAADDVPYGELTSFPRAVEAKPEDTIIFSVITYKDRATRDAINKKVMEDPRMKGDASTTPFDMKRMIFGGFVPFLRQ